MWSRDVLLLFILTTTSAAELSPVPFTWTEVTEREAARRLRPDSPDREEIPFVQRTPSSTSRIFELAHGFAHLPAVLADETLIKLPVCAYQGRVHTFRLRNSDMIPPALQAKFPDVRAYHAFELGGSMHGEVTMGPGGLRAQIWVGEAGDTICYIDPHSVGRSDKYTIYSHADVSTGGKTQPGDATPRSRIRRLVATRERVPRRNISRRLDDASDLVVTPPEGLQSYRTYKICVSLSPDYFEFAEGRGTDAMSLLVTTMSRANGIWKRVLSINLVLCDDQAKLMRTAAQGNKVPNGDPDTFLDSCSDILSAFGVTSDKYDLAHYMSASGGGGLGACCACGVWKCAGGTALKNPVGDSFNVDYVAHEMGHQFGHSHTFSGAKGSCGSNFFAGESVEPGSGHTILSYAGICGQDNSHKKSSPYFASVSLGIYARTQHDGNYHNGVMQTCGTVKQTSNNRPTAKTLASCVVPKRTPFVLRGSGSDPDVGTTLTYNWEQVDSSKKPTLLSEENKHGALFLSVEPSTKGHTRHFPRLATSLRNRGTKMADPLERMSSIARDLHFTMTVRDQYNREGGGDIDKALGTWHASKTTVNVAKAGPLEVLGPTGVGPSGKNLQTGGVSVEWRLLNSKATDAPSGLLQNAEYSVEYAACEAMADECTSTYGWQNEWGENCDVYETEQYCTASGTVGPGWDEDWGEWNKIEEAPVQGSPSVACCACGGGTRFTTCTTGDFVPLAGFDGTTSWKLSSNGFARARVSVPSSLAGKHGVFRVVAQVSSETMTDDVYCKAYALSSTFNFTEGVSNLPSVKRTIPADGATGVPNTGLQLTIFLDRDASLSATAASKEISVKSGLTTLETILGNSSSIVVEGNTIRIFIGDVGSYEVEVKVPADLISSLPEQTITFNTSGAAADMVEIKNITVSANVSNNEIPHLLANAAEIMQTYTIFITLSADAIPGRGVVRLNDWESDEICTIPAASMSFDDNAGEASFILQEHGCFLYQGHEHFLHVDADAFVNPMGGLTLESNYSLSFWAWVDTVPPRVVLTHPVSGSTHISDDEAIFVWFNEDVYAMDPPGNITITPRTAGKTKFVLPANDMEQVIFDMAEDFTGEILLWPSDYFQPRTTYDVSIPNNTVVDWPGNVAAPYTFSFTTGDNYAPYCDSIHVSEAEDSGNVDITIVFQDWAGQDEPSRLSRGKSGNFRLWDNASATNGARVPVTDEARVKIDGLIVNVSFPLSSLTNGSAYMVRWPDNVVLDDFQNPVFKSSHEDHEYCQHFIWVYVKRGTGVPTLETTPPPPGPTTEAPMVADSALGLSSSILAVVLTPWLALQLAA